MSKILCVGWQKTGTKSIGAALRAYGHKTQTWNPDLLYRWHEGKIQRLVNAFAKADAFDDFPWMLVYREFDEAYPDAKFILTVRESDEVWLKSLQDHIARSPRSLTHYLVYGSYDPIGDAERHVARYREHNEAVRRYFAKRPGKLLEMCLERGDGWKELCAFLGKSDVPPIPFPRLNTRAHPLTVLHG